jgi:hypothetical protein
MRSTGEYIWRRAKIVCDAMQAIADEGHRSDTCAALLNRVVQVTLRRLGYDKPVTKPSARGWLNKWLENEKASVSPSVSV